MNKRESSRDRSSRGRSGSDFVERLAFEERLREFIQKSKLRQAEVEKHAYHKTRGQKNREKKRRSQARQRRQDEE